MADEEDVGTEAEGMIETVPAETGVGNSGGDDGTPEEEEETPTTKTAYVPEATALPVDDLPTDREKLVVPDAEATPEGDLLDQLFAGRQLPETEVAALLPVPEPANAKVAEGTESVALAPPDASAPAADRVEKIAATPALATAIATTGSDRRVRNFHAASRSDSIVCSRRARAYHSDPLMKARNAIGSGDRAEIRRPPTVVRKPPLTARITAVAASTAAHAGIA